MFYRFQSMQFVVVGWEMRLLGVAFFYFVACIGLLKHNVTALEGDCVPLSLSKHL
jgi:hypothetical protein